MKDRWNESSIFQDSSKEELKKLAIQGLLTWKTKKIYLDPFTPIDLLITIESLDPDFFNLSTYLKIDQKTERLTDLETAFPEGVIMNQSFRFWRDSRLWDWFSQIKQNSKFDLRQLEIFIQKFDKEAITPVLEWKCPIPQWRTDPIPILKLHDRFGAFANLWMDYGKDEIVILHQDFKPLSSQALFWEKDLLETDFIKKQVGSTFYYCPMDKVVKTLSFLLDCGWTILDHQNKRVLRQNQVIWESLAQDQYIAVRAQFSYGNYQTDITQVVGAFNRKETFLQLNDTAVGLLEASTQWNDLFDQEMQNDHLVIPRFRMGVLEDIVPIPVQYQLASWEKIQPSSHFQGTLFEYQKEGLHWLSYLYHSKLSGLLADEMGLGKTIQVIALLSTLNLTTPFLIVVPVSLLFHWKRELTKRIPHFQISIHQGSNRFRKAQELLSCSIILISYTQLRIDRLLFESLSFQGIILDEAQWIKNPEALTTQTVCRLKAPFKLAITGTPIENRFEDLWSIFRFLMPELLGEKTSTPRYESIRKKIRPFILRRTKQEIQHQLPEKQEQLVWIEMDDEERAFYDHYLKQRRSALNEQIGQEGLKKNRMQILELILRLRQICCHGKLVIGEYLGESAKFKHVCQDLEEVVLSGHKVLVYSQFTSMLGLFRHFCSEKKWAYAYLDGQTQNRESQVQMFQQDPTCQIFLISLKAGGVGLNLQAADYVFLYDPWWNTAVEKQAIDRAHRIGRKNPIIARKYIINQTIEEKVLKIQEHKEKLSQEFLDLDENLGPLSLEALYALLQE